MQATAFDFFGKVCYNGGKGVLSLIEVRHFVLDDSVWNGVNLRRKGGKYEVRKI